MVRAGTQIQLVGQGKEQMSEDMYRQTSMSCVKGKE